MANTVTTRITCQITETMERNWTYRHSTCKLRFFFACTGLDGVGRGFFSVQTSQCIHEANVLHIIDPIVRVSLTQLFANHRPNCLCIIDLIVCVFKKCVLTSLLPRSMVVS